MNVIVYFSKTNFNFNNIDYFIYLHIVSYTGKQKSLERMPPPSHILTKIKDRVLNIKVYHSRYLSGLTVVISIPCPSGIDSSLLLLLKGKSREEDKGVLYKNTELTVLFHALHADIMGKLKLPAVVKTTGLIDVQCHYYNKQFNLVFQMGKETGTAAKKILSEALGAMKPSTLYSSYSTMLRILRLRPNREEFNWCVVQVNKCLRQTLGVFIVGKINLGRTPADRSKKLKIMVDAAKKKLKIVPPKGSPVAPESLKNEAYPTFATSVSITGLNGFYLAEYTAFKTKGAVHPVLLNNRLVFPPEGYEKLMRQLKERKPLNTFVTQKYARTKDALTPIVLKNAADLCMAGSASLFSVAEKTLKPSDVAAGVISALS